MIYAKVFPTNFFLLSKTAFRVSVPNYEVDMMSSVNTFFEVNGKNGKSLPSFLLFQQSPSTRRLTCCSKAFHLASLFLKIPMLS